MNAARLLLATVVIGSSCKEPAPPTVVVPRPVRVPVPPAKLLEWASASRDGTASLEQSREKDACETICAKDGKQVWALAQCVGRNDDLRFVSNDCHVAAVLVPFPPKEEAWPASVLLRVITDGVVSKEFHAQDFPELDSIKRRWLAGTMSEVGEAPHYTADGTGVEFHVISILDGRRHVLLPLEVGQAIQIEKSPREKPRR